MISKHSTIPVPDSLQAPRKISFIFHFWHKCFIPWWCETCRVVQLQATTVLNESIWHFRWSKHTLTPPTYFQGVNIPQPPGTTPLAIIAALFECVTHCGCDTSVVFRFSGLYGAIEIRLLTGQVYAWPFSVFTQKQFFGHRTAKSQPIWIKYCTHLLLYCCTEYTCGPT